MNCLCNFLDDSNILGWVIVLLVLMFICQNCGCHSAVEPTCCR